MCIVAKVIPIKHCHFLPTEVSAEVTIRKFYILHWAYCACQQQKHLKNNKQEMKMKISGYTKY